MAIEGGDSLPCRSTQGRGPILLGGIRGGSIGPYSPAVPRGPLAYAGGRALIASAGGRGKGTALSPPLRGATLLSMEPVVTPGLTLGESNVPPSGHEGTGEQVLRGQSELPHGQPPRDPPPLHGAEKNQHNGNYSRKRRRPKFPRGRPARVCRPCHVIVGQLELFCIKCHAPTESTTIYNEDTSGF